MNNKTPRNITANQLEEGDTQTASFMVPVTITANQVEMGDTQSASITVRDAVELESKIPADAKQAIRDFIEDQIEQLNEATGEFILNIPEQLVQFSDVILEIITKLTGWG